MHFQTQEILFFSLNKQTAESFERYITNTKKEYVSSAPFILLRESKNKALEFEHIQELHYKLEHMELGRLANLIVIIDPYSLPCYEGIEKEYSQEIKELVLQYPEVKFVFFCIEENMYDWQSIINANKELAIQCTECCHEWQINGKCKEEDNCTCKKGENCEKTMACEPPNMVCKPPNITIKLPYIHSFYFYEKDAFKLLINGKSNLFDASNLRNLIRQDFFQQIKVGSNYPKSQKSRAKNLALCVDEEIHQSYFNAYAMYVHGFRAMPVVSYSELKYLHERFDDLNDLEVIIRDYDLQFENLPSSSEVIIKDTTITKYTIDILRGLKYGKVKDNKEYKYKWFNLHDDFWDNFKGVPIYFVSRFDKSVRQDIPHIDLKRFKKNKNNDSGIICNKDTKTQMKHKRLAKLCAFVASWLKIKKTESKTEIKTSCLRAFVTKTASKLCALVSSWLKRKDKDSQTDNNDISSSSASSNINQNQTEIKTSCLRAFVIKTASKLCALVSSWLKRKEKNFAYLRGIPKPINGIFEFQKIANVKDRYKDSKEKADFRISRSGGEHAVSPFITHIAESLINRSKQYYKQKMFMLSALLAKEAMEVLNGFHLMLMLETIYWQAVAENAMVMSTLGSDEDELAKNTRQRLKAIREEVERFCKNNPSARKNVLSQIFNDIRNTCREYEQFKSADIALKEFVNLRHGNNFCGIFKK
jgi:hypothetical protein